ncbi:uncharacterized protein [Oscarella lobularis]|uniref:uncharacterized protein isoform X3 n=1 Tax=Oscarella lobularis TaxID=121494 RepID=UPI003313C269
MRNLIVLLAAGVLLCSAAPGQHQPQQHNQMPTGDTQRKLQDMRDAAARQKLPSHFVNNRGSASLKDIPPHTLSRLPHSTLQKITPMQVKDKVNRFSQLGPQNLKNFLNGLRPTFSNTLNDWKAQAHNLTRSAELFQVTRVV